MNVLHRLHRLRWKLHAIDSASLHFRLMLGMLTILILSMGISTWLNVWMMHREMMQVSTSMMAMVNHFMLINLFSSLITVAIAALFIQKTLRPLRRLSRWAVYPDLVPLQLHQAPSEVRTLAETWNGLLSKITTLKQQQRQFTNDVAHELRSPLSLVHGYLQRTLRRSHDLSEAQRESLVMATEEAERMTHLLQNLIDLARTQAIDLEMDRELLDLNAVVTEIAEMTEQFEHRPIQTELAPTPIRLWINRDYLTQMIHHLIRNAVISSQDPVTVHLEQRGGAAVIQVSDRGCGIAISQQNRIFEPFFRVDPARARTTGGAGLGLAIVKSLAEQMGGQISLQSELGQGSTFTLTLPLGVKP